MLRNRRARWVIGSVGLLMLAACASTPSTQSHTGPTAIPRSTPTASASPTAALTSTRYSWTQLSPSVVPLARNSAGFAYDAATGTDLLTGGRSGCAPGAAQYVDTWSWNGTAWTQLHPAADGPGHMQWFTMAYDDATRQEIAVGAYSGCGIVTGMWSWNGSQWTQAPQNLALPDPMASYSLAYDSASRTMILFGDGLGAVNGEPVSSGHQGTETWSWNGSRWTHLHPATSPPAMRDSAIAYDAATRQIVLFGGNTQNPTTLDYAGSLGGTWLWNGTTWSQATPPVSPSPRYGASLAYDPDLGTTLLFGGVTGDATSKPPNPLSSIFDDLWSWNGSTWTQLHTTTLPLGRFFSQMTYDSTHHELVLFGGSLNQNADVNDTWVLRTS